MRKLLDGTLRMLELPGKDRPLGEAAIGTRLGCVGCGPGRDLATGGPVGRERSEVRRMSPEQTATGNGPQVV